MPKQAASLSTIARLARVSASTVSRALSDHPALPAATRKRLQRLAEKLGYRRNGVVSEVMRRARSGRHARGVGNIGYLSFGDSAADWRRDPTFSSFYEGARNRAQELGYELEHVWSTEPGMTPNRLTQILGSRGIAGVIIGPSRSQIEVPSLDWNVFAPVKVGVPVPGLAVPCACHNHYRAMLRVLEELTARGYRRPGLAMPQHVNVKTAGAWAAPLAQMSGHLAQLKPVPSLINTDWAEEDFARWMEKYEPDAVIALHDDAMGWLRRLKRRVPQDLGLACLDRGDSIAGASGIDQRPRAVGAIAVDLVVNRLIANERGIPDLQRTIMIDGAWHAGSTLRPLDLPG